MVHRIASSGDGKARVKPDKPREDFPLFAHATRRWAKKIGGKLHYFGPWEDPDGALLRYLDQKEDLHAGRKPRARAGDYVTIRDLLNRFLTTKENLRDASELTTRTLNDYHAMCERVGKSFGLGRPLDDIRPEDFETLRTSLARSRGPVSLGNEVQRVRTLFKYAYEVGLLEHPVRFGPGFKRPNLKTLRINRASKGLRMFTAAELRRMLAAAPQPLKAMLYLGINCGYGNADVGKLPLTALDLDAGWANYPRPKTGIPRRCPLWPETIAAVRAALAKRKPPKNLDDTGLVFITIQGHGWFKDGIADSPVSKETAKLLQVLGIKRQGLNFYGLRHTFETIGGDSRDQVAVDHLMGHSPASDDMAATYREKIDDYRLRAVVDHVRSWVLTVPKVCATPVDTTTAGTTGKPKERKARPATARSG